MRSLRHMTLAVALGGLAGLSGGVGGCASETIRRPMLESSVVEGESGAPADLAVGGAAADLEFFDRLSVQKLVCHDDAVHAGLLLVGGPSAPEYAGRVARAERLAIIDPGFDRPSHEAVTIGDVSKMLVRIVDGPRVGDGLSQERAVSRLVTRGWLPAQAKAYQGLTGAQFVTLIGTAREERVRNPKVAGAGATSDEVAAIGRRAAQARPEPLPVAAIGAPTPPTLPTLPTPPTPPRPVAEVAKVVPPPTKPEPAPVERKPTAVVREPVAAAPSPAAEKPTIWVPGKPLKRPAKPVK